MMKSVTTLPQRACVLLLAAGLFGCTFIPQQDAPPDLNPAITQAYQTVSARLTQLAATGDSPGATASLQPPAGATLPPAPSQTAAPPPATQPVLPTAPAPATFTSAPPSPAPPCNQAAAGVPIDVTIPDDSPIQAGQAFTKTWRLRNVGSCTWNQSYRIELFSGDAMGAPLSQPLPEPVAPGQQVDLSLDLTAPLNAGPARGDWKLRDPQGKWFGIGPSGGASFWVQIIVLPLPTPTVNTALLTPTPTATLAAPSALELSTGQRIDLDLAALDSSEAADVGYDVAPDGRHTLISIGPSKMAVFGVDTPALSDCQAAQLADLTLDLESLPPGSFLCYQTGQGTIGRLQLLELDPTAGILRLEIFNWPAP